MKKGFTLIELIVVIAIIATLASLIMASRKGAEKRAANKEQVSCYEIQQECTSSCFKNYDECKN